MGLFETFSHRSDFNNNDGVFRDGCNAVLEEEKLKIFLLRFRDVEGWGGGGKRIST